MIKAMELVITPTFRIATSPRRRTLSKPWIQNSSLSSLRKSLRTKSGPLARISSLDKTLLPSSTNSTLSWIPSTRLRNPYPKTLMPLIPNGIDYNFADQQSPPLTDTNYLLFLNRYSSPPRLKQPFSSIPFLSR